MNNSIKSGDANIAKMLEVLNGGSTEETKKENSTTNAEAKKKEKLPDILDISNPMRFDGCMTSDYFMESDITSEVDALMNAFFLDYVGCYMYPDSNYPTNVFRNKVPYTESPGIRIGLIFHYVPENNREELLKIPSNKGKTFGCIRKIDKISNTSKGMSSSLETLVKLNALTVSEKNEDIAELSDSGRAILEYLKYDNIKFKDCSISQRTNNGEIKLDILLDVDKVIKRIIAGGPSSDKYAKYNKDRFSIHFNCLSPSGEKIYTVTRVNVKRLNEFNRRCGKIPNKVAPLGVNSYNMQQNMMMNNNNVPF